MITGIVFTQGCNFRCPYCHNPELVGMKASLDLIHEAEIFKHMEKRKGLLDALTITGGEPTLQQDLKLFISRIREMGFAIKLDSNGSDPDGLEDLYKEGLLDYVAMDIKGPLDEYPEICGYRKLKNIEKSIKLIMNSGVEYEFRTTVLPALHNNDSVGKMGEMIRGADKYFIQNFRAENTLDPAYGKERSFTSSELSHFKKIMEKYVDKVAVRENV